MEKKGQGTIEYLVIIAIVIVIALVVVGLLLQVMNSGSGIPETQAKATWKSAEPLAIIDWGVTSDVNQLQLVLRNNSAGTIEFNDFNLSSNASDTTDKDYNDTAKSIAPGATYTIYVDTLTNCTAGSKYSYPKEGISIDYNTVNINGKTQKALADIVGTC